MQSPGRHDGPQLAIAFARQPGDAARLFADRLDGLTQVGPLDFEKLAAQCGTTPDEAERRTQNRHVLLDDEPWFSESGPSVIEAGGQT